MNKQHYLTKTDNLVLPTVSWCDNCKDIHFMQVGIPPHSAFLVGGLGVEDQQNVPCAITFSGHETKWKSTSQKQEQLTNGKNDFEVLLPLLPETSHEKKWRECVFHVAEMYAKFWGLC